MAQQNNLDFNMAANVKGMEQIATLINRVNALEAETKKLASANANLTNSNNSVIQSGTRYNNALDAQSKQLRNARQGTQQLGMQINDFATSVSTGASVSQAFNQQLGQLGYAMSMMGGTAGKVGAFLAGPWGAAITLAVVALGPFIDKLGQAIVKLFDTETALDRVSKKAAESMAALKNSLSQTSKQGDAMTDVAMKAAIASKAYADANKNLQSLRRAGPPISANEGALTAYYNRVEAATKETERLRKVAAGYESEVRTIQSYAGVQRMQQANEKILGTAPKKERAPRKRAMTQAEKDAKKLAESLARWELLAEGKKVDAYDDLRKRNYESAQSWQKLMQGMEESATKDAIDAAQERMDQIATITAMGADQISREIDGPMSEINKAFENIGNTASDAFKGMLTGAMSWKDGMRSLIGAVIDELWRLYVVQQIVGFVTKALGGIGLPLPAPVPGKAVGGYVGAQQPYVVGEKGPELFIPGGSGTIIPNKNMAMGSGGNGGVTVNVDARGSADPAAVRAQVEAGIIQAAPAIIAAAQQRTVSSLRRPKLGGAIQ